MFWGRAVSLFVLVEVPSLTFTDELFIYISLNCVRSIGSGVGVGTGVGAGVGASVGSGVSVTDGVSAGVGVSVGIGVSVTTGVSVATGVSVITGVAVDVIFSVCPQAVDKIISITASDTESIFFIKAPWYIFFKRKEV